MKRISKLILDLFQYIIVVFLVMLLINKISERFLLLNLKLFLLIVIILSIIVFLIDYPNKRDLKVGQKRMIPYRVNIVIVSIIIFLVLMFGIKSQILFSLIAITMIVATVVALKNVIP